MDSARIDPYYPEVPILMQRLQTLKRGFHLGALALLALPILASAACAGDPRETPLVRALRRAKSAVVNIHSEKTARTGETLFRAGQAFHGVVYILQSGEMEIRRGDDSITASRTGFGRPAKKIW